MSSRIGMSVSWWACGLWVAGLGCTTSDPGAEGTEATAGPTSTTAPTTTTTDSVADSDDTGPLLDVGDGQSSGADDGGGGLEAVVYAHSATTLYRLDPDTLALTEIGDFSGDCLPDGGANAYIVDLAVDEDNDVWVSGNNRLLEVDTETAECTTVLETPFGNNLSFVPVGVLDESLEVLVSYQGANYQSLDPTNGEVSMHSGLPEGVGPSGDLVSVDEGGTFLSANDGGAIDQLLQIDPATGEVLQDWGLIGNYPCVFGLAFWAGTAFGFTCMGDIIAIEFGEDTIEATLVEATGIPFAGAGSSTKAPPTPVG